MTPTRRSGAAANGGPMAINGNAKANVLSNKALAYLNSKKATSILKSYEDAVNSTKFMNSAIGKNLIKRLENSQSNSNFTN